MSYHLDLKASLNVNVTERYDVINCLRLGGLILSLRLNTLITVPIPIQNISKQNHVTLDKFHSWGEEN